jgi:hypothetical protein
VRVRNRERRLATATARVVRPGTPEAANLDAEDDAYWDTVPVDERLMFAFSLAR